ncbi:MAG: WD40 repeat domain-containing protein [Planctomycetes bacterium]|nr:WD40 repeat domain-containing protein [Planctomycetota bacterium]
MAKIACPVCRKPFEAEQSSTTSFPCPACGSRLQWLKDGKVAPLGGVPVAKPSRLAPGTRAGSQESPRSALSVRLVGALILLIVVVSTMSFGVGWYLNRPRVTELVENPVPPPERKRDSDNLPPKPAKERGLPDKKKPNLIQPFAGSLELTAPPVVTLKSGEAHIFEVSIRRQSCEGEVEVRLEGLGPDMKAAPIRIPADRDRAKLSVTGKQPGTLEATVVARLGELTARRPLKITVMAATRLAEVRRLRVGKIHANSLVFSADGKSLHASVRGNQFYPYIQTWDVASGGLRQSRPIGKSPLRIESISPDGERGMGRGPGIWISAEGERHMTALDGIFDLRDGKRIFDVSPPAYYVAPASREFLFEVCFVDGGRLVVTRPAGPNAKLISVVEFREARTGKLVHEIPFHRKPVVSPNGQWLAHYTNDNLLPNKFQIELINVLTGKKVGEIDASVTNENRSGGRIAHSFSHDGGVLAGLKDGEIFVWNCPKGEPRQFKPNPAKSRDVKCLLSPDGKTLASFNPTYSPATGSGTLPIPVMLWDVATGEMVRELKGHHAYACVFSPDSKTIATAGNDSGKPGYLVPGDIRLWDVASGKLLHILNPDLGTVSSAAFSADGKRATFVGSYRYAPWSLWNLESGDLINSSWADSTSRAYQLDGFARENNIILGKHSQNPQAPIDQPAVLEIKERKPKTKDLPKIIQSPTIIHSPATKYKEPHFQDASDFLRDGRVVLAHVSGAVWVWDYKNKTDPRPFLKGHEKPIRAMAVSSDGSHLATASADGTVKLWNVKTAEEVRTLKGHAGPVLTVAFSPDGTRLASGGADGIMKIWNVAKDEPPARLQGHTGAVHALVWTPAGKRVLSGGEDQIVRLWDANALRELHRGVGHQMPILAVGVTTDGTRFHSASRDGTIRTWEPAKDAK